MPRYRKKPVVVEAKFLTDENKDQVFNWISCSKQPVFVKGKPAIKIHTLEGTMTASIGDYIIKGVEGEFYPCKPDIFRKAYEKVNVDE